MSSRLDPAGIGALRTMYVLVPLTVTLTDAVIEDPEVLAKVNPKMIAVVDDGTV